MHVVIGLVGLCAVLWATFSMGHAHGFTGVIYPPAILLLAAGPLFVAVTSYRFEELFACLRAVGRGLRFRSGRSRAALFEDLTRFAAEIRRRRPAEALALSEASSHELFRQLAPLVVKQYSAESIESTATTASYCQASSFRRSENVLVSLARVAPAMGLVGTVLGLITLLKDLSDFKQIGPSMALALLCTLYGLVLANALYQPLSRVVHSYATAALEESKLLTRSLILISEGKPVADVRKLFTLASTSATPEPEAAADLAVGGER